jgi:lysophospholipase L1-like esterase
VDESTVFQGYGLIENKLITSKIKNLSFLNLKNVFAEHKETMYLDTVHFGDKGNQVIGEALAGKVITLI